MIGTIAAVVAALAGATATGYSIYRSQNPRSGDPSQGWTNWERAKRPAEYMFQQMYYSPLFAGAAGAPATRAGGDIPYAADPTQTQLVGQFRPPQALESLYSHYLTRSYGLPERVARGMSTASLTPLRAPTIRGGALTPAQMQQVGQPTSQALTQAAIGYQQPNVIRNLDYLQNAANLAEFNAWRVQQLPRMIG